MRRDRDSLLILICLVPAVYLIYSFFTYQATGSWPLSLPNFNLPSVGVPSFLHPVQQQSPQVHHLVNQVTSNWVTIVLGTIAGLIFGIFLVGLLADLLKMLFRIGQHSKPAPAADADGEVLPSESA